MDLVTMGEAAQRLGVSVDTIRRRLRRGGLQGQHQPTPQGFIWLIEMPEPTGSSATPPFAHGQSAAARADANARPGPTGAETPAGGTPPGGDLYALRELVDVLRHEIDTMDRQLEAKDGQLNSKDRQIEQLHLLLKKAQSGSNGPKYVKGPEPITPAGTGDHAYRKISAGDRE